MKKYDFESHMRVTFINGDQIRGHSPFREDKNPSFSANTETGLWKDFGAIGNAREGNWKQFCELLGISSDFKKEDDFWKNAINVDTYLYYDEQKQPRLKVERYENDKLKKKLFIQSHLLNGCWEKGKGDVFFTPYRYHDYKDNAEPICFVEGEKCVDAIYALGLLATTFPGGANIKDIEKYQKYFNGRTIYLIPDNDEVGKAYSLRVADVLFSVAKEIKIIDLELVGKGDDICEWLRDGNTKEQLLEIFKKAEAYKVVKIHNNFGPLKPLPDLLPKVPILEDHQIPEPLRAWVKDVSERMNVSKEFILIPALVGLASIIGRRLCIMPKQYDPWYEVINLWGLIVGAPSVLKTPSMNEALGFVSQLNAEMVNSFQQEKKIAEPKINILKIREKALSSAYKKAITKGEEHKDIELELGKVKDEIALLNPKLSRLMLNDTTIEKLCELLVENPNGLLVYRDELSGWLASLSKAGREEDRPFYLEAWNGKDSYTVDRIMRGTHFIPALRVAIMGGIQPAKLSLFIEDIVAGGSNADGLFNRFQLAVYPDKTEWKHVDRRENKEAKSRVHKIFEVTLKTDFSKSDLECVKNIPAIRFSNEAQLIFNNWLADLEGKLAKPEITENPYFEAHLGKYRSLMPKLACLFEVINWADLQRLQTRPLDCISAESAKQAMELCIFLEFHAKKIHAIASELGVIQARALAKKIINGEIKNKCTVREIRRPHWKDLSKAEEVDSGLALLESYNWLKIVKNIAEKGGRPSETIELHPDLIK